MLYNFIIENTKYIMDETFLYFQCKKVTCLQVSGKIILLFLAHFEIKTSLKLFLYIFIVLVLATAKLLIKI